MLTNWVKKIDVYRLDVAGKYVVGIHNHNDY
jgi:hypothetical protein